MIHGGPPTPGERGGQIDVLRYCPTKITVADGGHESGGVQRSINAFELGEIRFGEASEIARTLMAARISSREGIGGEQDGLAALPRRCDQAPPFQGEPDAHVDVFLPQDRFAGNAAGSRPCRSNRA